MNCNECRKLVDERVFGPDGDRVNTDVSDVQGHLDHCRACREDLKGMLLIGRWGARVHELEQNIPREVLERNRRRVFAAIEQAKESRHAARPTCPLWTWAAAAAVALVAAGLGLQFSGSSRRSHDQDPIEAVQKRPAPVAVRTAADVERTGPISPVAVVEDLVSRFEKLKNSPGGVPRDFLSRLQEAMREHRLDLDGMLTAQKLLADTYGELGERDLERRAFGKWLVFVERRHGRDRAARYGRVRADKLFYAEQDYLGALAYYDLMVTLYPETRAGQYARFMVGKYYQRQQMWTQALAEYKKVAEEMPDSEWARRAHQEIWAVLANLKRTDEALEALRQYAEDYPEAEDAGYAHFQMGCVHHMKGVSGYPKAVREFRYVVQRYPGHRYAASARGMLAKMNRRLLKSEFDNVLMD